MDTFMQVLITIVIGIASLLVVTMTKHHHKKVVVFTVPLQGPCYSAKKL